MGNWWELPFRYLITNIASALRYSRDIRRVTPSGNAFEMTSAPPLATTSRNVDSSSSQVDSAPNPVEPEVNLFKYWDNWKKRSEEVNSGSSSRLVSQSSSFTPSRYNLAQRGHWGTNIITFVRGLDEWTRCIEKDHLRPLNYRSIPIHPHQTTVVWQYNYSYLRPIKRRDLPLEIAQLFHRVWCTHSP